MYASATRAGLETPSAKPSPVDPPGPVWPRPLAAVLLSAGIVTTGLAAVPDIESTTLNGTTIQVTITADELDAAHGGSDVDTGMSLREAIIDANATPSVTTVIRLGEHTYTLTRAGRGEDACVTGDLDVRAPIVIEGVGDARTFIDAAGIDRGFHVAPGGRLQLQDLTLSNGLTTCGEDGGGILAAGDVSLLRMWLLDSATGDCEQTGGEHAGHGGGILCDNTTLTVLDSKILRNTTGRGSHRRPGADSRCTDPPNNGAPGGNAGNGGGIAAESCTVTIERSHIMSNRTGDGGEGGEGGSSDAAPFCRYYDGADGGPGGDGGDGGGIWLHYGAATIVSSTIFSNAVGTGGYGGLGGTGEGSKDDGAGGEGGDAGNGGGIATAGAVTTIRDSVLRNNHCSDPYCAGGPGVDGADDGDDVMGGAIYSAGAGIGIVGLIVERCSLYNNRAWAGGGIANHGKMVLRNTTLTGNAAEWHGSAVYDSTYHSEDRGVIDFCTIAENGPGHSGLYAVGSQGPAVTSTIIAGNTERQYYGTLDSSSDHNLVADDATGLGPLRDNGGETPTMALLDGSAAINAGDPAIPASDPDPATDQRGSTRVSGGRSDCGAYEKAVPPRLSGVGFDTSSVAEGVPTWVHGNIVNARFKQVTLHVRWGDGTESTYHYSPTTDPFPFNEGHTFGNNPPGTPALSRHADLTLSEDGVGTTAAAETVIEVINVAPTEMTLTRDPATLEEGTATLLMGSIVDSVADESFTVEIDWGDGTPLETMALAGVSTFATAHVYADDPPSGSFTITAHAADAEGLAAPDASTTVTVTNVAPGLADLSVTPNPVSEGATATLSGSIVEPGAGDVLTLVVDWGDGSTDTYPLAAGTASFARTHSYADDEPTATAQDTYTLDLTLSDDDGGSGTGTTTVTVANAPPRVGQLAATPCEQGGSTTLTGTISDPGTSDSFTLAVDWGDGDSDIFPYPAGTTELSVTHQVVVLSPGGSSPSPNQIAVTVSDDDTGSSTAQTTVQVTNVAPQITELRFAPLNIDEGVSLNLRGAISDPGGTTDSHTMVVDWGDGTSSTHAINVVDAPFFVPHTYADDPPGSDNQRTATVTITDAHGGRASGSAVVTVHNVEPTPMPDTYQGDEDIILLVPADGVLRNDTDVSGDTLHVVVAASDTVSARGAAVTLQADGSFAYDPTAPTCEIQGLLENETVDDTFSYAVADEDMQPDTLGAHTTTVTISVAGHVESRILYVDATAGGADDGTSWGNAFLELADALAVAWGGDTIHVAAGTYTPDVDLTVTPRVHTGDRSAAFEVHRGVALYGGFPPGGGSFATRSPAAYPTVLSGDIGTTGDPSDNSLQVVRMVRVPGTPAAVPATVIDGFTVADGLNDTLEGGGMLVSNGSPVISRCTFSASSAPYGGGLALVGDGAPHVVHCTFVGNQATSTGLQGRGGGLYTRGASPVIAGCVFRGNTALEAGGGLAVAGGGIPEITGCTFTANTAGLMGGGLAVDGRARIHSSILWGNACSQPGCESGQIHDDGYETTTVSYSDVQGSGGSGSDWWVQPTLPRRIIDGGGNIDADPLFLAAPADLHLDSSPPSVSPAIDAGSNAAIATDAGDQDHDGTTSEELPTDLDGLPRRADVATAPDTGEGLAPVVDMGAYEAQAGPVLFLTRTGSGTVTSTPAGIDCGGACVASFAPAQVVTLGATPADGSSFAGWMSSQPTCLGAACTLTMPPTGSVWAGALFVDGPTANLAVTLANSVDALVPGSTVTYTLTVTNAGPSEAAGATVHDSFPATLAGVTWTCLGSTGSVCTAAGTGDIADTVTIPAHGSVTYTATATLVTEATGTLINTATVAPPIPDPDPTDNTATDTDTITPQADLAISVDNGTATVTPGVPLTYTIVVENQGPSGVTDALVTDAFPAALSGVTWTCTPSPGAVCTPGPEPGDIDDSVTIPAGGRLTYQATGTLHAAFTGVLTNTAQVDPPGGTSDADTVNNTATDMDTAAPSANLSVVLDDGRAEAVPGMSLVYTLDVANPTGPSAITGAAVEGLFPAALTCAWSCSGSGGGSCTPGLVDGDVHDAADLPVGGSASYTVTCEVAPDASGSLVATAEITTTGGGTDPDPADNSASDTDTVRLLDYGDAPDESLGPPWSYPVTLAADGARHGVVAGFHLGTTVTAESDGSPSAEADTDAGDDGIAFAAPLVTCESCEVTVTATAAGTLDAWVDLNADGDWDDHGEQVLTAAEVPAGVSAPAFTVPCSAAVTAETFARFRFSTAGIGGANGVAGDGEVEDLAVAILGLDLGDAPDAPYPTLPGNDGARHVRTGTLHLGTGVDAEGEPRTDDGDDGVTFTTPVVAGATTTVTVSATAAGVVDAWLDHNADGDWDDADEQVLTGHAVAAGANHISFAVPATAPPGAATWARFRLSSAGGLASTGLAPDGEVEDYPVTITGVADLEVTVDDGTDTALPGGTVRYTIVATNHGPTPAASVHVTDAFPAALNCSWHCSGDAGGGCAPAGSGAIDDLASLPAGASITYVADCTVDPAAAGTLVNTAEVVAPGCIDPTPGNASDTDTDDLIGEGDLAVAIDDGVATVVPGRDVTYTITVTNTGPSQATGATVGNGFAGLERLAWSCTASSGSSCSGSGAGALAEEVTLAPGGSVTFTATGTLATAATGTLTSTATVTAPADFNDGTGGNDTASDTNTVSPEADLGVTASAASSVPVGGTITSTIELRNLGPSDAQSVLVSHPTPADTTFVSAAVTAGSGWSIGAPTPGAAGDVVFSRTALAAGESASFTVAVETAGTVAVGDVITSSVTVVSSTTDPETGNDAATASTTVTATADVAVTAAADRSQAVPGENVTYTLDVSNDGPDEAWSVTVSNPTPTGTTFVAAAVTSGAAWTVDAPTPGTGGVVSFTRGPLPGGEAATFQVVVEIEPTVSFGEMITNTVTTANDTHDDDAANDSATVTIPVCAVIDLEPWHVATALAGQAYAETLQATGGTAPYTYTVSAGALPVAVMLDGASGAITGTPSASAAYPFTATATGNDACTGTRDYVMVVACDADTLRVAPESLPTGSTAASYSVPFSASGGTGSVSFAQYGPLPDGLTFVAGELAGTPNTSGIYPITVAATDATPCTGGRNYHLVVEREGVTIDLAPAELPDAAVGVPYSQTVTASGGTAPYSYRVTSGALPAGLTLDAASGLISGTPTSSTPATFTITALDATDATGSRSYSPAVPVQLLRFGIE